MPNVIVAGGAGFIGSHVCRALAEEGFTPIVYDNLLGGHAWAVQWGPLVVGDIFDTPLLEKTLKTYCPIGVIHLASHIDVRESVADPAKYYRNNFFGTLSLVEAMRRCNVENLVFSSTAAVYGCPSSAAPIAEENPKAPINPYGRSKWMAEQMLQDAAAAYDFPSVSLRYFNAAGADIEAKIGEAHEPETHLIPKALFAAAGKTKALPLYGADHPTEDGTPVRDYIHVADLALAHVQALQWLQKHRGAAAFNLGTGSGYSVKQVLETIERVTGKKVPIEIIPRFASDPAVLVANAAKAHAELNFKPRYSALACIVETAWKWHLPRI